MTLALASVAFVVALWWSATGAIFWLDRRGGSSRVWTIGGATLVLLVSLLGLAVSARSATPASAFLAFACALGVWGWNEVLFLSGAITGPNRRRAPDGLSGWPRFRAAAGSVMHHEVVLLASGAAVLALTSGAENHVGLCAFMTLWIMRLSAKLNIFFGVPNPGERFLPERLRYLAGHFRRRPVGLFFGATFTTSTVALGAIALYGAPASPSAFEIVSVALVSTLLALAVIEHVFLAVPWDSAVLWSAALKRRSTTHANDNMPDEAASDRPVRVHAAAKA